MYLLYPPNKKFFWLPKMAKETHCQTQARITSYSSQQMKIENSNREKLISIVEEQNWCHSTIEHDFRLGSLPRILLPSATEVFQSMVLSIYIDHLRFF